MFAFEHKGNVAVTLANGGEKTVSVRGLLAVVVRAAIISVPWVVRIIIRCVVSIIACLGRANAAVNVMNIGAAAE